MSERHNLGERVKFLREQVLHLSQRDFASQLGVSGGLIGQIETAKGSVSAKVLLALEERLSVNPDWLLDGVEPIFKRLSAGFSGRQLRIDPPNYAQPGHGDLLLNGQDYAFVRRMMLSVSAGNGLMPVEGDDAETLALPTRWFSRQGISADLTVLVTVQGDSMAPAIPDGALVLLHVAEQFPTKSGVFAFNRDGEIFLKRIFPTGVGKDGQPQALLLVSDNPAYPPIALAEAQMNEINIIGRVRAVLSTV